MKRKPMRMSQILVGLVAAIVAVTLAVWVTLYLHQYRAAAIQNAGTSSAQAVSQVAGTVGNYMEELGETMDLVVDQVQGKEEDQAEFFSAFLRIRPAVIAVTRYDEQGNLVDCRALNHTPRKEILKNLSFDLEKARNASGRVVTAPHVETIFQGYYPWVVTIVDRVTTPEGSGWVALDLSFSGIADTINNVGIGRRGYCFLLDDSGSIVYHPQQQLLYAGLKSED
ncbi:cache domain-containing protein, partial [bacterium]|nr:cache domain-containing protein [bacterium]